MGSPPTWPHPAPAGSSDPPGLHAVFRGRHRARPRGARSQAGLGRMVPLVPHMCGVWTVASLRTRPYFSTLAPTHSVWWRGQVCRVPETLPGGGAGYDSLAGLLSGSVAMGEHPLHAPDCSCRQGARWSGARSVPPSHCCDDAGGAIRKEAQNMGHCSTVLRAPMGGRQAGGCSGGRTCPESRCCKPGQGLEEEMVCPLDPAQLHLLAALRATGRLLS